MATYSLNSIDETAFVQACNAPSHELIRVIAESLARAEVEGAVWTGSPDEWIRGHLSAGDWYESLSEDEMEAWEAAVREMLDEPQFALKSHGFHCAVGDMFIEMAAKVYRKRSVDAVVLQFWPYRFFDTYDLDYTGYSPTYALLTNEQIGRLIDEVADYDALMAEYAKDKPEFVDRWREQINDDVQEAMPALQEIYDQKRMWYAQFDF